MDPKDSLSFEIFGVKVTATGRFAICAILLLAAGGAGGRAFGIF